MEGDLIAQMSSSVFAHDVNSLARKRDLAWQRGGFLHNHHQEGINSSSYVINPTNWDPKAWFWDSARFVAKPASNESNGAIRIGDSSPPAGFEQIGSKEGMRTAKEAENLTLKLGGRFQNFEEPGGRLNKRVRSGSPANGGNYPICQVDDCKADLSSAKDYHRRHKVCEIHSKTSKAVVGSQMQRFCQQCSRFHSLGEFDEGKRSCRRRLAGHNRRRRKNQPKDDSNQYAFPTNQENRGPGNLKTIDVSGILARLQGHEKDKSASRPGKFDLTISQNSEITAPSTRDLLSVLSSESKVLQPMSGDGRDSSKKSVNPQERLIKTRALAFPSLSEVSDHSLDEISHDLELQLFSSSDGASPPKTSSSSKYQSTENSSPIDDRSALSSPAVQSLFPLRSGDKDYGSMLGLSGDAERILVNGLQYRFGDTSSSGSDQSPSTSDSGNQDRTGRIIFKLFGKDPSSFPGALRNQILSWLSHSPSDMEGYIRPGCVVLSIYLAMPSFAWAKLERDLSERVKFLIQSADSDFWRNARFVVHTANQLASHKDGKVRLCKSWITLSAPEITSVSPLAVVSGEETLITIRGRNLAARGTKLHCAYVGTYTSTSSDSGFSVNSITFNFPGGAPNLYGRFFLEVENGFKGNNFPVIVADPKICQEIRALEPELDGDGIRTNLILHFLNELGWLFQRKSTASFSIFPRFSSSRFKFLILFSVDRDWSALVKKLLDCLMEEKSRNLDLAEEYSEMLSEIRLVHRAVSRRSRKMVELLLNFLERNGSGSSAVYLFPPDVLGPGGLTPLHLAASMDGSEDIVDALTDDPQEIGLESWSSSIDEDGKPPYYYALMRNNQSYNRLVDRKLDRRRGQLSIAVHSVDSISQELPPSVERVIPEITSLRAIYSHCSFLERRTIKSAYPAVGFQIPFMHPILAIAAVCVCVCVFLRGSPVFGSVVSSFSWESLGFGPR
ncbi:squamosa promoter-binding-like protein 15 [Wolffia australiana]